MALLTNINGKFSVSDAGAVTFNNAFTFPTTDGTANYVLKTNGSGTVSWSPDSSPTVYWAANGNDIYNTNSANVGIGTNSPVGTLSVRNTTAGENVLRAEGVAGSLFIDHAGAGNNLYDAANHKFRSFTGVERMRITSAGDVGIGTSSFGHFSTAKHLLVEGDSVNTNSIVQVISNDNLSSLAMYSGGSSTDDPLLLFQNDLRFGSATNIGLGGYAERMRIDSAGNVGIGTDSPDTRLHVVGPGGAVNPPSYSVFDVTIENSGQSDLGIIGTTYSGIYFGDAANALEGALVYSHSDNHMSFRTNGNSEKMRITSAGVVEIKNTGAAHLILNGDTNNSGDTGQADSIIDFRGDGDPGAYGYRINTENWSGQTALNFQEYINGSYTSRLFISKDGKVGIGTTGPATKLDVVGADNGDTMRVANTGTYGGTISFNQGTANTSIGYIGSLRAFEGNGSGDNGIGLFSRDRISFYTNSSTPDVTITSAGVLRVGTTPGITPAILTARKNGTCIEFGHGNNTGRYEGTLGVFGSSGNSYIGFATSCDNSVNTFTTRGAIGNVITGDNSGNLDFKQATNANASGQTLTQRMRISNVGRVTINTTVVTDARCTIAGDSSHYALSLYADVIYASVYRYQRFRSGGNIAGGIEGSNQTSVVYGTSSDYRMKKNIKPLENGLERLSKLKPVKFDWKLNDETTEGFIAHEVQDIFPDAISGVKDGEDMQGMDYGRITPLLVAAIQELKAEIEILKNK